MASDKNEFYARFPSFTGLANDFSDPVDDSLEDADIARNVRKELDAKARIEVLSRLLSDSERILAGIAAEWRHLAKYVNRHFVDEAAARDWLLKMSAAWDDEQTKLRR